MNGRGSKNNPQNRFLKESFNQDIEWAIDESIDSSNVKTKIIETLAKTMMNEVKSPDLSFMYSMNPYQGCEHGCAYCYARPTHEYWGYGAGIDFESVLLVKKNAPDVFENELRKFKKTVSPIVISGNTDCYQPIERKYQLTRQLLQICLEYRYPVSIITKNALILRDLDIIIHLSEMNLISVWISITSVDDDLRRMLEPRTSTYINRFKVLQTLSKYKIPCGVMVAPIIPGLNDKDIPAVLKQSALSGAHRASYTIVRLNDSVFPVFSNWLQEYFPDRKDKVLSLIKSCHHNNVSDYRIGKRFKGDGEVASSIYQLFNVCYKKYFDADEKFIYNTSLFNGKKSGDAVQGSLF